MQEITILHVQDLFILICESDLFVLGFVHWFVPLILADTRTIETKRQIQETVEAGLKERNVSARRASLDVAGNDGLIRDIRAGVMPAVDRLDALMDFLGPGFQFGASSAPVLMEHIPVEGSDYARIPLRDAKLSAGPGQLNEGVAIIDHAAGHSGRQAGLHARTPIFALWVITQAAGHGKKPNQNASLKTPRPTQPGNARPGLKNAQPPEFALFRPPCQFIAHPPRHSALTPCSYYRFQPLSPVTGHYRLCAGLGVSSQQSSVAGEWGLCPCSVVHGGGVGAGGR